MHFKGFPSTVNLTSLGSNPISEGISGRSLLEISSVERDEHLIIEESSEVNLLLFKTKTVREGILLN